MNKVSFVVFALVICCSGCKKKSDNPAIDFLNRHVNNNNSPFVCDFVWENRGIAKGQSSWQQVGYVEQTAGNYFAAFKNIPNDADASDLLELSRKEWEEKAKFICIQNDQYVADVRPSNNRFNLTLVETENLQSHLNIPAFWGSCTMLVGQRVPFWDSPNWAKSIKSDEGNAITIQFDLEGGTSQEIVTFDKETGRCETQILKIPSENKQVNYVFKYTDKKALRPSEILYDSDETEGSVKIFWRESIVVPDLASMRLPYFGLPEPPVVNSVGKVQSWHILLVIGVLSIESLYGSKSRNSIKEK